MAGCASGSAAVPGELPPHGDDSVAMPSAKPSTAPATAAPPLFSQEDPGCVRIAVIPIVSMVCPSVVAEAKLRQRMPGPVSRDCGIHGA
jgi:hypothetical protein